MSQSKGTALLEAGGAALADSLRSNGALTALHLSCCRLGPEGVAPIAAALEVRAEQSKQRATSREQAEQTTTPIA